MAVGAVWQLLVFGGRAAATATLARSRSAVPHGWFYADSFGPNAVFVPTGGPGLITRTLILSGVGAAPGELSSAFSAQFVARSVHRVFEPGKPRFQLRRGEEGVSVFDAKVVQPHDILPHFRSGSQITTQEVQLIESFGLKVVKTPGDSTLPKLLQDNHFDIQPSADMTRNQFKAALKRLNEAAGG